MPWETGRAKAPTIVDVAREAGVSKSAVSRALLHQGEVSERTRLRVMEAAERLGYVANAMAQGLVSQSTHTLGVVLRDATNPFYGYLHSAMQRRAQELGYRVVVATGVGELTADDARDALHTLVSLRVDGLIVCSAQLPAEQIIPFVDRVPIVVVGRPETNPEVISVQCDEVDGGRRVAEYVARLGHRKVAVLLVPASESLSQNVRGSSMIQTLREAGVEVQVVDMITYQALPVTVVAALEDPEVTALMCPTDHVMVRVLNELRIRDIAVPGRLSVTGYDGIGQLAEPFLGLTTFRQPIAEMGTLAVDRVLETIENGAPSQAHTVLKGTVVPGRTTAPPRATLPVGRAG